jgi:membrane associated rhomboid family serine protease
MCAAIALGIGLQLAYPSMLGMFQRDAARIAAGEWWRLVTALFLQDGGVAGGLSNLAFLVMIGSLAERVLPPARWLLVYAAGGLIAEVVALAWQPIGAGNSIAICALAGFLLVDLPIERARWPLVGLRLVAGILVLVLLATENIHGIGALVGAALAAAAIAARAVHGAASRPEPTASGPPASRDR